MAIEIEKPVPDVCPFCFAEGVMVRCGGGAPYWVVCRNQGCRAEGPICNTEHDAVARWNAVPRNRPKADALADLKARTANVGLTEPGSFRDRDLPAPVADTPLLPLLAVHAADGGGAFLAIAGSAADRSARALPAYKLVGHLLLVSEGAARG